MKNPNYANNNNENFLYLIFDVVGYIVKNNEIKYYSL